MKYLSRHLQSTVQDHIERYLVELGWIGPVEDVPFGALPVEYQRVRPQESQLQALQPNIVAVSFGSQSDDAEQQLGGGLVAQTHVLFVDVYAENEGVGLALSEDVRDLLVGRESYAGRTPSRFLQLEDQEMQPPTPVPGYQLEFTGLVRAPAARELSSSVSWQVISGDIDIHLPGES